MNPFVRLMERIANRGPSRILDSKTQNFIKCQEQSRVSSMDRRTMYGSQKTLRGH